MKFADVRENLNGFDLMNNYHLVSLYALVVLAMGLLLMV